jgi:hypothetical protein
MNRGLIVNTEQGNAAVVRLPAHWLWLARIGWITLAVLSVISVVIGFPLEFQYYQTVCNTCGSPQYTPQQARELRAMGLSLGFYAGYVLAFELLFVVVWFAVAAVIFWRRWGKPDEPVAWFISLTLLTFGSAFPGFSQVVALYGFVWMLAAKLMLFLGGTSIVLFFYLFPTGRFVPRWTRFLGALWVLLSLVWIVEANFSNSSFTTSASATTWDGIYFLIYYFLLGIGLLAQVYRYVRVSNALQRQQTKWVIYSFALAIGGFLVLNALGGLSQVIPWLMQFSEGPLVNFVVEPLTYVLIALIPISIGFAVLRYRLYDIDLLINRSLVYGTLTVLLALVYVGLIIGLQALLGTIIKQDNGVAIVLSTLAIYVLFRPLRRRVQAIIDRRFYRRKYDAARTLAAFSASLRNEVDLEQLSEQLLAVVQETMQPAHVSLWLRKPERHRLAQEWEGDRQATITGGAK